MTFKSLIWFMLVMSTIGLATCHFSPKPASCNQSAPMFCRCGRNNTHPLVQIKVKACPIGGRFNTICEPCPEEIATACDKFNRCDFCSYGENGPSCEFYERKRRYIDNEQFIAPSGYPIIVEYPPGRKGRNRIVRDAGQPKERKSKKEKKPSGCIPNQGLETAEVKCWIWPTHVTCEERCVHGYRIRGMRSVTSKCNEKSPGQWLPEPLEECRPFVNCEAQLISPGDLRCYELTMEPQKCYIKCEEYGDEPAVRLREYICKDVFSPPLPHCAELDPHYQTYES